jgi:hypothetical protein
MIPQQQLQPHSDFAETGVLGITYSSEEGAANDGAMFNIVWISCD